MQFKQKEGFHLIEKNKQELWQQRISDWEQSGMEIRAWCSKNHIEEQQFHYYKRQLRVKQDTAPVPMFAEVSLGSSASTTRTTLVENDALTFNNILGQCSRFKIIKSIKLRKNL